MLLGGARPLTRCIAVVDSRNVRGQGRKVFGHGRECHVEGIRAGLRQYGFDPVEVLVGVATRTAANRPSERIVESLAKNRRYKERLERAGAQVLEGLLVQRGSDFEEKQVDVLCALAIADAADRIKSGESPAECIVVLSEDMDLMPAIDFAARRQVRTYAAAYDTVHQRPMQKEWILLHEQALIEICDPPGRTYGSALRDRLAAIAASASQQGTQWKIIAPRISDGRSLLTNNLGANGLWKPTRRVERGERLELYVTGVEMDPHSSRFPYLVLDERPPGGPCTDIEFADVLYWSGPTDVRVRLHGSIEEATLRASPGMLLPGQEVAVLRVHRDGNNARYLVGALTQRDLPKAWPDTSGTAMVRVTALAGPSGAWLNAQLLADGTEVLVKANLLEHVQLGDHLVVALVGEGQSGTPQTMPLTCCLP